MKKGIRFLYVTVAMAAMSVLFSSQAMATLYATGTGVGALSGLYTVDPSNGASSLAWNFSDIAINNGGLAYDKTTDTLFATGVASSSSGISRLYSINRTTGAAASIGGISNNINISFGGLAIHPVTGVMYATGDNGFQSTGLFTIDKATGAATLLGQAGGNYKANSDFGIRLYGLGFRSDGTLFANGSGGGPSYPSGVGSYLFTVNLANGEATKVGPSGVNVGRSLQYSGLAFREDGTLLSLGSIDAASGALYSVNPVSGEATSLSGTGLAYGAGPIKFGVDGGLTFVPSAPVPIPSAVLLMGTGLVGLLGVRRKKK